MDLPQMTTIDHLINSNIQHSINKSSSPTSIGQLDRFLNNLYRYYLSKGIAAVVLSELCSIVSLGFTIGLSIFIILCVDWSQLLSCDDERSCHQVASTIIINPLHSEPTMLSFLVSMYFILSSLFWMKKCIDATRIVSDSFEMSIFYRDCLGLQLHDLETVQWFEVVDRLLALHNHGSYRLTSQTHLSVYDVVQRIMRRDNYLIGMINMQVLDLCVPWWMSPLVSERLFLTQSLEWSLSYCIFDGMFDDRLGICKGFLDDVDGLRLRFQLIGLLHFLLLPFMVVFMTVHFFLRHAQQFHSNRSYLGPRQWSPLALWKFREFNELPHLFEQRMSRSSILASAFIATFSNPYITIFAKFVSYISGSFLALLLVVSVLGEGALLYVHIADHNLLWWLGMLTATYTGARALIPDETKDHRENNDVLLEDLCAQTHYCPDHWSQRSRSVQVKDELCELFQFKAQIFLMEIFSVLLTPMCLCFSLPSSAPAVLAFIRKHSRYVDHVGVVCDYSLFDFERFGDEDYGAEKSRFSEGERLVGGKLENSFLSFGQAHPTYQPVGAAKAFHDRLNSFKDAKRHEREELLRSIYQPPLFRSQYIIPGSAHQREGMASSTVIDRSSTDYYSEMTHSPIIHYGHRKHYDDGALSAAANNTRGSTPEQSKEGVDDTSPLLGSHHALSKTEGREHVGIELPRVSHAVHAAAAPTLRGSALHSVIMHESRYLGSRSLMAGSTCEPSSRSRMGTAHLPSSVLMSILRQENIDYENDFYWIQKFHHERLRDPVSLERSLLLQSPDVGSSGGAVPVGDSLSASSSILPPFLTNTREGSTLPSSGSSPPNAFQDLSRTNEGMFQGMEFSLPSHVQQGHTAQTDHSFLPSRYPYSTYGSGSRQKSVAGTHPPPPYPHHSFHFYPTAGTSMPGLDELNEADIEE